MLEILKFLVALVATIVDMAFRADPHAALRVRPRLAPEHSEDRSKHLR
jgi:hypothetical protein